METITFWHWLILGIVLVVLEVLAPGVIFMWMGIAAIITGIVLAIIPGMGWEYQLILFSVLSIISVGGFRFYSRQHPPADESATLNRRGHQYIGRTFALSSAIENGVGKIHVDDSQWIVHGQDCAAGEKVKVIDTEGTILIVETHGR